MNTIVIYYSCIPVTIKIKRVQHLIKIWSLIWEKGYQVNLYVVLIYHIADQVIGWIFINLGGEKSIKKEAFLWLYF